MNSNPRPRSSVIHKILRPEISQPSESEAEEPLREVRASLPTPMLDLVMKDGSVESFSYAYLTRVSFDPKGRLVLYFGEDRVVIEGRNLLDIRQKVRLHKANEIYEGSEAEDALKPESAAHVERIEIAKVREEEGHSYDPRSGKSNVRQ